MERTFLFHALATGVSGKIDLPFNDVIEIQASSALPTAGGYSTSRVESFRYKEILSFDSATTIATGSHDPDKRTYNTMVTSTVEHLNILNVVTADRIVARLASEQPEGGGPPSIIPLGSHFENLRIAGIQFSVRLNPERLSKPTPKPAKTTLQSLVAPFDLKDRPELRLLEDGAIQVSQFGRIYLAEFLNTPAFQSVTMIRVVLGCAVCGKATAAYVSSNGEFYP
jgi:hypothetical protein